MPLAGLVTLVSLACWWSVTGLDFVSWDDHGFVVDNPNLRLPIGRFWVWAWTTAWMDLWHPLVWLTFRLDYALWGLDPRGYHLTNAVVHALTSGVGVVLVDALLDLGGVARARPRHLAAALAGLAFAVHPVHVESVAWVVERKDVVFGLFYLLALLAWVENLQRGGRRRLRALALVAFLASLASKPMAVTLPALLCVLDLWPAKRVRGWRDAVSLWGLEKLPFWLGAVAVTGLTLWLQAQAGNLDESTSLPLLHRLWVSTAALGFYLGKALVPVGLVPLYPVPSGVLFRADMVAWAALALGLTSVLALRLRRWPLLAAAWACFALSLSPMLGLLEVGRQFAADRYLYVPLLAPLVVVAAALTPALHRRPGLTLIGCASVLVVLQAGTLRQIQVWSNSLTLWDHVATAWPDEPVGRAGRGEALVAAGRVEEGMADLDAAVALELARERARGRGDLWRHLGNRGKAWYMMGQPEPALADFQQAADLRPDKAVNHFNLGTALGALGRTEEAVLAYRRALALDPDLVSAHNNLATSLVRLGRAQEALPELERTLELDPTHAGAWSNKAVVLGLLGRGAEATEARARAEALGR